MLPPSFHDWQKWIDFREWVNKHLHLKEIILGTKFKIFIVIFIILTFMNCLLALFTEIEAFSIIDDVFMGLYCL